MICELCQTGSFYAEEGSSYRWMWLNCANCDMSRETRKTDYNLTAEDDINKLAAIEAWNLNIQRLKQSLKENITDSK